MAVIVSIDLGTTKITSLALDADRGTILARGTALNDANVTPESDRAGAVRNGTPTGSSNSAASAWPTLRDSSANDDTR